MGNRYYITGVQLGLLVGIDNLNDRQEIAEEIEDKQYLCEAEDIEKIKSKKGLGRSYGY